MVGLRSDITTVLTVYGLFVCGWIAQLCVLACRPDLTHTGGA